MKGMIITLVTVAAMSLPPATAQAGGWGSKGNQTGSSGGLINISPNVNLGSLKALNNIGVLNGNNILSGNKTSIGNGILSGVGIGILSGNNSGNRSGDRGNRRH